MPSPRHKRPRASSIPKEYPPELFRPGETIGHTSEKAHIQEYTVREFASCPECRSHHDRLRPTGYYMGRGKQHPAFEQFGFIAVVARSREGRTASIWSRLEIHLSGVAGSHRRP